MGLFKNYVSQTRKPEGILGKIMLAGMNSGHSKMADWGLSFPVRTAQKRLLHSRTESGLLKNTASMKK